MQYMTVVQELFREGGPMMVVLAICFFLMLAVVIGRVFHFHRAQIDVHEFIRGLYNILKRNRIAEAVAICDDTPGPVAHVVRAAILHGDRDEMTMRRAVEEVGFQEVPRLEKNLRLLATIGYIAPLLGLLGTVSGLLRVFGEMQGKGHFVETIRLAQYVKEALVTTGAGLLVAVVAVAAYNYLVGRVEALVLDMEKAGSEVIYFLLRNPISLEAPASEGMAPETTGGEHGANEDTP
ncbi:MAG: MotA/TolQ/ExbB proton channel family protein [Lentisphaeria bacterium]|nr:MotA/TolQ/ExbB proton channel family protein [Lentisphaeria bacterium]